MIIVLIIFAFILGLIIGFISGHSKLEVAREKETAMSMHAYCRQLEKEEMFYKTEQQQQRLVIKLAEELGRYMSIDDHQILMMKIRQELLY